MNNESTQKLEVPQETAQELRRKAFKAAAMGEDADI